MSRTAAGAWTAGSIASLAVALSVALLMWIDGSAWQGMPSHDTRGVPEYLCFQGLFAPRLKHWLAVPLAMSGLTAHHSLLLTILL